MLTDPDLTSGQLLSGKFEVERVLGRGGMGAVYVARHVYTKRRGALKLLHKTFAAVPEVVERFIREASAAGVIDNPHVVETYDAGLLDTGEPYMFMELLDGLPLDELLDQRSRLRFDEAVDLIAQAAEGLAAAHASGVVHRDVKPGNLFLVGASRAHGGRPFVKLLDFGISKFAPSYQQDQSLTIEGRLLGTPLYMSPEQVNGQRDLDARADIYALGVVLYEMLAGQPPFIGASLMELSVRIHDGKYVPISALRPDAPDGFDAILAKAMAVDREQRFTRVDEFRAELVQRVGARADSFAPTVVGRSDAPLAAGGAVLRSPSLQPSPPPSTQSSDATLDALSTLDPKTRGPELAASQPERGSLAVPSLVGAGPARKRRGVSALVVLGLALATAGAGWLLRRDAAAVADENELVDNGGAVAATGASAGEPTSAVVSTSVGPGVARAQPSPSGDSVVQVPTASVSDELRVNLAPTAVSAADRPADARTSFKGVAVARSKTSPTVLPTAEPTSPAGQDGLTESNPFAQ